ncbi:TPA: protein translocase SEC61 complex subunit gamma [Candidatus Bathyarchaeota archaeon]|nr:protein translocase SEC61 complex subunit gamma [Candidatus Bathyarchaeota archaeon]
MGFKSFLESCNRLLHLAKKPGKEELWLSIKICVLGVSLIGTIGFIIKILSLMLSTGLFGG